MKVTGIVAEYNPFHNGHKYHMESARSLTGADFIIVVMSGNYTQRGLPALLDKYTRAQMALENGADLVLELPLPFAVCSAEYFASASVALLNQLGVTDDLCFGSECGEVSSLTSIARTLLDEPPRYRRLLQQYLDSGLAFPVARKKALLSYFPEETAWDRVLDTPNNILGIEYIKAILHQQSNIQPITLKRTGSGYHEEHLSDHFSSATALRLALKNGLSLEDIKSQVPESVSRLLAQNLNHNLPIFPEDFSLPLHYKLLCETRDSLTKYADVSPDLADRIQRYLPAFSSFPDFCDKLKSKNLTHSRISRSLLHILLDITVEDLQCYRENGWVSYGRILGLKKEASPLLHSIKRNTEIPLISKLADSRKLLSPQAFSMLEKETTASHIYEAVVSHKFGTGLRNEYTRSIPVL